MKTRLLTVMLFCTFSLVTFSQNSTDNLLNKLIEKQILTQEEADEIKLESEQDKPTQSGFQSALKKIRTGFDTPYIKFGGYGMLTYQYHEGAKAEHDFRPRVVFLSAEGYITPQLKWYILADFVNPAVHEYYAEWMPSKMANIRAGQFKVPLTLENQLSLTALEMIYNARSVSSLAGMAGDPLQYSDKNSTSKGGRDIGIQLSGSTVDMGSHDLISYTAGLFQGTGVNVVENNNHKDFAGMLLFEPIKGWRIGGSTYFGQSKIVTETTSHVRNRWTISSDYDSDKIYARAEYLRGNDGGIDKEGIYGVATYKCLENKLHLSGKVDYYNSNKNFNSEAIDYTAGVSYFFYKKCRMQLNYTYSDYNKKWNQKNSNFVAAQMQIVF